MSLKSLYRRTINRRGVYRRLFMKDDKLTPDAEAFFADLSRFCRFKTSTLIVSPIARQTDAFATLQAEGRREVFLRMISHLKVDDSDLLKLQDEVINDD